MKPEHKSSPIRAPRKRSKPRVVSVQTQTEAERAAMALMQLEMALAVAREKGLTEMVSYLEAAIADARETHRKLLS